MQKEWYRKLKDEGFNDIEQDENNLKAWHSHRFKVMYPKEIFQGYEEYYRSAGKFLYDHSFKSILERAIWELHANGMTITNITKTLKERGFKVFRTQVGDTTNRLAKIMLQRLNEKKDNEQN